MKKFNSTAQIVAGLGRLLSGLVDLTDVFVFAGLGLVGYGLHIIYAPAAFIVVGAALFWLGVRH